MKAVVVFEAGGTDKLIYTDIDKPKLKEGWSLVKVKAFGINRSEIFTRKGYSPSVTFPRILGIECAGVIEESKTFEVGTKIVSIMGEMGRAFDSFDKILELIGPCSIKDSLRHLNRFGIICSAGQLGEKWFLEDFDPIMELKNDVYLTTFYSGNVDYERIKELFDFIDENNVVVKPNKVFKLSEIKEAHEYLDSKNGIGKAVCVV